MCLQCFPLAFNANVFLGLRLTKIQIYGYGITDKAAALLVDNAFNYFYMYQQVHKQGGA